MTKKGLRGVVARTVEHMLKHQIPPFPSIPLLYDSFWKETSYLLDEARKRVSEFRRMVDPS